MLSIEISLHSPLQSARGVRPAAGYFLAMALAVCLASLPAVAQDDDQLTVLDLDQPLRSRISAGSGKKTIAAATIGQDELTRKMRLRQEATARQGGNPGAAARVSVPPISIGNIQSQWRPRARRLAS